ARGHHAAGAGGCGGGRGRGREPVRLAERGVARRRLRHVRVPAPRWKGGGEPVPADARGARGDCFVVAAAPTRSLAAARSRASSAASAQADQECGSLAVARLPTAPRGGVECVTRRWAWSPLRREEQPWWLRWLRCRPSCALDG